MMKTAALIQLDFLADLDATRTGGPACVGVTARPPGAGQDARTASLASDVSDALGFPVAGGDDVGDTGPGRASSALACAGSPCDANHLHAGVDDVGGGAAAAGRPATPAVRVATIGAASEPARAPGDPKRGIPGEVSAVVAAAHWGCSRDAAVAFVRLGHVAGGVRRVGSRDHCHVVVDDWSLTLRDRVVALIASRPPLGDVRAFRRLDEIKVKSDCVDVGVDDHWIESYFALPDRHIRHDYPQEIRSVLTASDEEVSRVSRILQLMDDDGRVYADRVAIPEGDLRTMMVAALSPDVPPLEFTWLHPTAGDKAPPVDEVACARILRMPPGRRRDRAIVHVASAAANAEMIQQSVQALSHYRTVSILDGIDDDDEAGIEARWTAFLKGELMPTVGRSAVVRTFHDELACERTMLAYAEEPVSKELKEWLWANAPLVPSSDDFLDLVRDRVDKSVAAGEAKRKARSDVISDAFDDHAAENEAALAEARAMHDGIRKGHARARDAEAYQFSFPMPILGEGRRDTGATMLVDFVSVRCDALLKTLIEDAKARGEELTPKSFLRRHAPGGDRHTTELGRRRFAVYVGTEALDPAGPPAADPTMMAAFKVGAMLAPGMLPNGTVAARRAYFAATSTPIPALRPRGLVGGRDPFESHLMVWGCGPAW